MACGFATAAHDRTLDFQDAVRSAALIAQTRAERALRESEARLHHLATHDPVTGLPNRALLLQWLGERATSGPGLRVGICCIDLDGFAEVNNSLGFAAGDTLLNAAADRLRILAGSDEWLLARLDGDQFALVILGTTGTEDAVKVADRALAVLAEPYELDGAELPLTASAGVAERPLAAGPATELLRAAQTALHWAKADGRARWLVYSEDRAAADALRYRLTAAIPAALRRGEFLVHYQPLVRLADRRLVGVEALARWRHPRDGLLPAGRFIGLAEQSGLIVPLGKQLLEQACRQAAFWHQIGAGAGLCLNVNLSASELHQPGLAGQVAQVLDRTGLPPQLLQVEISEQAAGADQLRPALAALARLGVRVAVDDFGVGYSNLSRLRELALHSLKLDATLVQHVPAARADTFLATVTALGHALGLSVVAEGIEIGTHAGRARAAGCDIGQGWHLGRPRPAEQITQRLTGMG